MRRAAVVMGTVLAVSLAVFVILPLCTETQAASAAQDWLKELDNVAKEFTAEMIVDGEAHPLEGPRRMVYYMPQKTEVSSVISGACYALHINGNPEVVIAIENSGDVDKPSTYIEVSRLSGGAIVVYRNGEEVAEFPNKAEVEGAYVGMVK